jgi:hypothetical protein|tara:strand:- start:747 stop:1001 length:255 start_codon:yes stop_codon:yes gene_type:complete
MSGFNVKFGKSTQNRVIQRDSGTNITLKSTAAVGDLQRLSDVDMADLQDGAVLVYEANTASFQLKQFLQVSETGVILFDAGTDF